MSTYSKWGLFWLLIIGLVIGICLSAATVSIVHWAGSDKFCTSTCHTMDGPTFAWKQGLHARTPSGMTANCSDCHLLHESEKHVGFFKYSQLLLHKVKSGTVSLMGQIFGTYDTPEKWMQNREKPMNDVMDFMVENNFANCRGCHDLADMHNAKNPMVSKVHQAFIDKPTNCLMCHFKAGHNYDNVDEYIRQHDKYPPLEDAWTEKGNYLPNPTSHGLRFLTQ